MLGSSVTVLFCAVFCHVRSDVAVFCLSVAVLLCAVVSSVEATFRCSVCPSVFCSVRCHRRLKRRRRRGVRFVRQFSVTHVASSTLRRADLL